MKCCPKCKSKISFKSRFNINEYYCNTCNTKYKKNTKLYNIIAPAISTIFTVYSLNTIILLISELIPFRYTSLLRYIMLFVVWSIIYELIVVILDIFSKYEDLK